MLGLILQLACLQLHPQNSWLWQPVLASYMYTGVHMVHEGLDLIQKLDL